MFDYESDKKSYGTVWNCAITHRSVVRLAGLSKHNLTNKLILNADKTTIMLFKSVHCKITFDQGLVAAGNYLQYPGSAKLLDMYTDRLVLSC